jgi:hypothetical protein
MCDDGTHAFQDTRVLGAEDFLGDGAEQGNPSAPRQAREPINYGGWPAPASLEVGNGAAWLKTCEQTHRERDVRELVRVGDLTLFRNLRKRAKIKLWSPSNHDHIGSISGT